MHRSATMFVGTAYEALQQTQREGQALWLFCLPTDTKVQGPLYFWSYVYYLSKARTCFITKSNFKASFPPL